MRAGLASILCLFAVSCAADDPVGRFEASRAEPAPIVETETLDVDLEALEEAAADPEPTGPPATDIPAEALDWTGRDVVGIDIQASSRLGCFREASWRCDDLL